MEDLGKIKRSKSFFRRSNVDSRKVRSMKSMIINDDDDLTSCDEKQLDDLLCKFTEDIFYDEENKEKLLKMDINQKKALIRSSRQKIQSTFELLEGTLDRLRKLSLDAEVENQETENLFNQLSAALRTESLRYVRHFMEADGLGLIFKYMRDCAVHAVNSQIFSQCVRCIRSLGNNENGYNYLLAFKSPDEDSNDGFGLLEVIGKGLWSKSGVTVSMICELFGALCFTEDGWQRVMKALLFLSRNDINHRLDILVQQFLFQENLDVKCAVLSLINAIAEFVHDRDDPIVIRVNLRYQTVKSGLIAFITPFTDSANSGLKKQIGVFIQHQNEDIILLKKRGRLSLEKDLLLDPVESWEELLDFIGAIKFSLACTDVQTNLISLLHHLLLLPLKKDNGSMYLHLIDSLVQHLAIQPTKGAYHDPILADLKINFEKIMTNFTTGKEGKTFKMENQSTVLKADKSSVSIPAIPTNECNGPVAPPPPPPPAAPPPPPPSLQNTSPSPILPRKAVPKVLHLKCFNWAKVPKAKLRDSVWNKIDENHIYPILDLESLQMQFSTLVVDSHTAFKLGSQTLGHKSMIMTSSATNVISNQRSQNLSIKLKPSRITWSKWEKCLCDCKITSSTDQESFPYQFAEGLLSLYPTSEEINLLEDAVSNHGLDSLSEPEMFMFECYKFPHYMERMTSLIFMCKAPEHIKKLSSEVKITVTTIQSVMKTPLLPMLLEIILAIGNVMNQKRELAYGFKLESLNQLKKLKCSQSGSEGVSNLLEYVIVIAEKQNPQILDLPKKLECVQEFAKLNVSNITKEINELSCGLKKLSNTIDLIRRGSRTPLREDHFLDVAKDVHTCISKDFNQLHELYNSIQTRIDQCHQFFGENPPSSSQSEDSTQKLFSELALFLSDMDISWQSILTERKRRVTMMQKRASMKPNVPKTVMAGKKGEMDVNISKLLSGDAFKEKRVFEVRQNHFHPQDHT